MEIEELLNLPLKEILENYSVVVSLECDYIYGISSDEDLEKIFTEYNISDEDEDNLSFCAEPIINDELLYGHDNVLDYKKLEKMMYCLGISKKGDILK